MEKAGGKEGRSEKLEGRSERQGKGSFDRRDMKRNEGLQRRSGFCFGQTLTCLGKAAFGVLERGVERGLQAFGEAGVDVKPKHENVA